jgi:hypothetical protein
MADTVEATRQHVQQEATSEFVGCERHGFIACAPGDTIVLPAEGDATLIKCDEALV